jgi:hypothetical protein
MMCIVTVTLDNAYPLLPWIHNVSVFLSLVEAKLGMTTPSPHNVHSDQEFSNSLSPGRTITFMASGGST